MINNYPTISISLSDERLAKVTKILRALRDENESISRSEAIGRAIDAFFLITCPVDTSDDVLEHQPSNIVA